MKTLTTTAALAVALLVGAAAQAGDDVEKGEIVTALSVDNIREKLAAWCDAIGGGIGSFGVASPRVNTPSSFVCYSPRGMTTLSFTPVDGGVRVKWTSTGIGTKTGAEIADALR